MSKVCFYHGNCSDGFASAWTLNKAFPSSEINFIPLMHDDKIPEINIGDELYILDFALQREQMIEISKKASNITLLDHHITALVDLKGVADELHCPSTIKFDMKRAGCQMTWDFFIGGDRPTVLDHVGDRDLREYKMENTRNVTCVVYDTDHDFNKWDSLMDESKYEKIIKKGVDESKKNQDAIHNLYRTKTFIEQIDGRNVAIGKSSRKKSSDLADYMLEMDSENEIAYAMVYTEMDNGTYKLTIRSTDDRISAEKIAFGFGGGGHRNMAGATVDSLPWEKKDKKTDITSAMEEESALSTNPTVKTKIA